MRGMTDNERYDDALKDLSERLRGLDRDIPVPDSVKAPQLLARMQRPALRVVHTQWKRYAGVAAAFVLIVGGLWTFGRSGMGGGLSTAGNAASSTAAEAMPEAAAAPQAAAMMAGDAAIPVAQVSDYTQVRARLAALQGENDYYVQAADGAASYAEAGGDMPAPGTGGAGAEAATDEAGLNGAAPRMAGFAAKSGAAVSAEAVQTDGGLAYYLQEATDGSGACVRVVSLEDLSLASTITFPQAGVVSQIFAQDGLLAVAYSDENFYSLPTYEKRTGGDPVKRGITTVSATVLEIYDMADAANPVSVRKLEQQGDYVYAGVEEDRAVLVTDCAPQTNARNTTAKDSELVPAVRDTAGANEVTPVPSGGVALPEGATTDRFAVVSSLPMADAAVPAQTKAVLGGASAAVQGQGVLYVTGAFAGKGQTGILKFTLEGELVLAAQGEVPGVVERAESLAAWDGALHVLAKKNGLIDAYVLDNALRRTGVLESVGGYDTGWYAAQPFLAGGRLYVVEPSEASSIAAYELAGEPRLLGRRELAGPNAMSYVSKVYAMDGGLLLTLGGSNSVGIQVGLFDVTEETPRLVQITTFGGKSSSGATESGSVVFSGDTVVLPMELFDDTDYYNGAALLRLTKDGISSRRVPAASGGISQKLEDVRAGNLSVRHCAVQNGKLYLFSGGQVTSWQLSTLTPEKQLKL